MPTPKLMMKGTVMGPVVTPPASKATARKSGGAKNARIKTSAYNPISSVLSLICSSVRRMAATRKTPTPRLTERISVLFGMDCTCPARTCRSGSEIVISAPKTKPAARMSGMFRVPVSAPPMRLPIGCMDSSAPSVKNIMPITSSRLPKRKVSSVPLGTGTMVRESTKTIRAIGMTAPSASFSFSLSLV